MDRLFRATAHFLLFLIFSTCGTHHQAGDPQSFLIPSLVRGEENPRDFGIRQSTPNLWGLPPSALDSRPAGRRLAGRETIVEVNRSVLDQLRRSTGGTVAVPLRNASERLSLRKVDLFSQNAVITATGTSGREQLPVDLTVLKGKVDGRPDSWAVMCLSTDYVIGMIFFENEFHSIAPLLDLRADNSHHVVVVERGVSLESGTIWCGVDLIQSPPPLEGDGRGPLPRRTGRADWRLICDLAVDCDYEYFANRFGGDLSLAANYISALLAVTSTIYERDINVTIRIPYLNIWTTPQDPYDQTSMSAQLSQFRDVWWNTKSDVPRTLAHLISGRTYGGYTGLAFLYSLCATAKGYGVSAVVGSDDYAALMQTRDLLIVSHEIGHNFGANHTHSCWWQTYGYALPGALLDSCATAEGSCYSGPTYVPRDGGTIMSYCPVKRLEFHPACKTVMRSFAEASCMAEAAVQPPTNLTATNIAGGILLTWLESGQAGVIRYDIYRSHRPLDPSPELLGSATSTSYQDFGMGIYHYKIRAVGSGGESPYSNEVTASICPFVETRGTIGGHNERFEFAVGELNEDGIYDLAVCDPTSTNLSILIGNGQGGVWDGSFRPPDWVDLGRASYAIAAGDFNDDGITDLAVCTGCVSILLGEGLGGVGNGRFAPPVHYCRGTIATDDILTGDFNEDGITDIAVSNGKNIFVLMGLGTDGVGSGTFAAPLSYPAGSQPRFLASGDFNEDGIADLAVTNHSNGTSFVSILLGQGAGGRGDGAFAGPVPYQVGSDEPGGVPGGIATGDFNEDGVTDLAVSVGASGLSPSISVLSILMGRGILGKGDGTFDPRNNVALGSLGVGSVGVADFDGNGIADLLVTQSGDSARGIVVLFGGGAGTIGDGSFDHPQYYSAGAMTWSAVPLDVNKDNAPDIALAADEGVSILSATCAGSLSGEITVISPNGGEVWKKNSNRTVSWAKGEAVIAVDIEVSWDRGSKWETITTGITETNFEWTVTGPLTEEAKLRVTDVSVSNRSDESDGTFVVADDTTPVVLSSFSAALQPDGVLLRWTTSIEVDNVGFNAYRSIDFSESRIKLNPNLLEGQSPYRYLDAPAPPSGRYKYWVGALDTSGLEVLYGPIEVTVGVTPAPTLSLMQNFPNPFNPTTRIRFVVPGDIHVNLTIFDTRGQLVATLVNGILTEGSKEIMWDARRPDGGALSAGIYICRLQAGKKTLTRKMVLLR